jgi:RNA polymerase sigma factor (sigma-70 family)
MQQSEPVALDEAPAAALYQRHAPALFAYLLKQTASRPDAEDLLLEVFLAAMERGTLIGLAEQEQRAWLWRVARNKAADYYRRMTRRPSVTLTQVEETLFVDEAQEPEQIVVKQEELKQLAAHIQRLPALQQDVLRLRFGHGLPCAEIATILQKKEGAVRMLLSRSMRLLRSIYRV